MAAPAVPRPPADPVWNTWYCLSGLDLSKSGKERKGEGEREKKRKGEGKKKEKEKEKGKA